MTTVITIVGFISVLIALFFMWMEFSNNIRAKRLRVTLAMWVTMGYTLKQARVYAKKNVK